MSRPSWNTLGHYNAKQPGTVQGPMVSPSIPSMKKQKPLYPLVKPGYNSLVYNGTGTAYYRVNEGPYGAWNKNKCSANNNRECWGGGPVLGSQRENYATNAPWTPCMSAATHSGSATCAPRQSVTI